MSCPTSYLVSPVRDVVQLHLLDYILSMPKFISFHEFCPKVLGLKLTKGQNVIAKVAFGDMSPSDLTDPEERELAVTMFGGVETVTEASKRYILLRLGRGSGKTTLCAAFAVYKAVSHDISKVGPGDVPVVITIAPDRETAKLSIRMAREMIRLAPSLERLIVSDTADVIQLRRPDSRMVRIEAFAASRGGTTVRGRSIMAFLFDEAEFFTSNGETGAGVREFAVNDKDIFRALKPRLMRNGKGMLISTPWPVETLMGEMFEENWGKCKTAVAIKAPTIMVRGDDPDIVFMVEDEMSKDPENARRELFCELDGFTGGEFFDANALQSSLEESKEYPHAYNPAWPVAVGCDLGFTRDSSAIVVVQYDGKNYRTPFIEELRPSAGRPLQPGAVMKKFAEIAKRYGASGVVADTYYRESLREALKEAQLSVFDAPEGTKGKADVFHRTRAVLHEGNIKLPDTAIVRRMVQQAKLVVSKAAPGGTTTIRTPRKIGLGHGDIVSAWVLAVHRLAYARLQTPVVEFQPGTDEWAQEAQRRLKAHHEKQQKEYLKSLEKDARKGMDGRTYRRVFENRF